MTQVSKAVIDQLTAQGIVPGTVCKSPKSGDRFTVNPMNQWEESTDGPRNGGMNTSYFLRYEGRYATVITPAPGATKPLGLVKGDACKASPSMRDAIIERAQELGMRGGRGDIADVDYDEFPNVRFTGTSVVASSLEDTNMPHHEFLARMEAMKAPVVPAPLPDIIINNEVVLFEKGGIDVGGHKVANATIRSIMDRVDGKTVAPTDGMREYMSCPVSDAMRAAIIELATTGNIPMWDELKGGSNPGYLWWKDGKLGHRSNNASTPVTVATFLGKLEQEAISPTSFIAGGYTVVFRTDAIELGCQNIPHTTLRDVVARLVD